MFHPTILKNFVHFFVFVDAFAVNRFFFHCTNFHYVSTKKCIPFLYIFIETET